MVKGTTSYRKRRSAEILNEPFEFLKTISPITSPSLQKDLIRNENLRSDLVAVGLHFGSTGIHQIGDIIKFAFTEPKVNQFVSEGKEAGGGAVIMVDEDQRRIIINQGEGAKLIRIEFPMRALPCNASSEDENTRPSAPFAQECEGGLIALFFATGVKTRVRRRNRHPPTLEVGRNRSAGNPDSAWEAESRERARNHQGR